MLPNQLWYIEAWTPRPRNVSCGIWHQDISSRSFKPPRIRFVGPAHSIDAQLDWNLRKQLELCLVSQTISEHCFSCGRVYYTATRTVLVDSIMSSPLYWGVRTHTDHRLSSPCKRHWHLFQQQPRTSPIQVLTRLNPAQLHWATSLGLHGDMATGWLINWYLCWILNPSGLTAWLGTFGFFFSWSDWETSQLKTIYFLQRKNPIKTF